MFVYLDETEFGEGQFNGYACLITHERIGQVVIDEALENLRNDDDRFLKKQKPMDDRTLDREYFHAADDSKNAHSHLCRAITAHVKGDFRSHIFHTDKHAFSSQEDLYELASKLAVAGLFSRTVELTFIFEGRSGLSCAGLLSKWWPELWQVLARNVYTAPFVVKYYPDVKFEIGGKREPGLQIVDFMLWASQRTRTEPKSQWFNWLPGWSKMSTTTVDGGWDGHSITMLEPVHASTRRYDLDDCMFDSPELCSDDILHRVIVNVQAIINRCSELEDKSRIHHFYSEVVYLVDQREMAHGVDHVKRMADCFIRLFDNTSLIQVGTPSFEKKFWLLARKCMAFVLWDGVFACVHAIRLSDIRNILIEEQPALFSEGINPSSLGR